MPQQAYDPNVVQAQEGIPNFEKRTFAGMQQRLEAQGS